MSELEELTLRITILRAFIDKKEAYYHNIPAQSTPARREEALLDCVRLRAELRELVQQRDRLTGGADGGQKD